MTQRYRVGLVGHGVGPSLSPALHMREAEHLGLDYAYQTMDLSDRPAADLGDELARLEDEGFAALNVTHPFKQAVLGHVDRRTDGVQQVGSANLVLLGEPGRVAHNTDETGFRSAFEDFLGSRERDSVLLVGAGGAGLAAASALTRMGFGRIVVHDLDHDAALSLAQRFGRASGGRVTACADRIEEVLSGVDGVVHVTPIGMEGHPGTAFDVDLLRQDAWVAEVVYRPLRTELVRRARARGLDVLEGGAMAVGQAAESLRLITGLEPDRARMCAHFDALVAETDRPDR